MQYRRLILSLLRFLTSSINWLRRSSAALIWSIIACNSSLIWSSQRACLFDKQAIFHWVRTLEIQTKRLGQFMSSLNWQNSLLKRWKQILWSHKTVCATGDAACTLAKKIRQTADRLNAGSARCSKVSSSVGPSGRTADKPHPAAGLLSAGGKWKRLGGSGRKESPRQNRNGST